MRCAVPCVVDFTFTLMCDPCGTSVCICYISACNCKIVFVTVILAFVSAILKKRYHSCVRFGSV